MAKSCRRCPALRGRLSDPSSFGESGHTCPMGKEFLWDVAAAFADIFGAESPPTHSDMDIAFRRAGVSSPQGTALQSIPKKRRIMIAFEQAELAGERAIEALIRALTTALATQRVFETQRPSTQKMVDELRRQLARLGWGLDETGTLTSVAAVAVQAGGRDALEQQLKRLRNSGDDVSLMLGAAKDAFEAAAKFVLDERQETYQADESLEALVNRAMKLAGISTRPADVTDEASKALAALNQTVPKIAEAVRKVRNDQGSGHGRTALATVGPAEAAYVRDLTHSVVNFLLAEHSARR